MNPKAAIKRKERKPLTAESAGRRRLGGGEGGWGAGSGWSASFGLCGATRPPEILLGTRPSLDLSVVELALKVGGMSPIDLIQYSILDHA
jgi:hypothetical protein